MNGLKVRKLAAIVAGGALLGAAVAPMVSAITSSEAKSVVYSAEMSPNVNIVVGSNAAVSDGVWAGNIARKIVEKAVVDKTGTGSGAGGNVSVTDLAAVLSLGGSVTVTGGKTFNNINLDSVRSGNEYEQSIGKDPLSFLKEESLSYKFNGSSSSIDVKETVGVQLDADFSSDSDVKDFILNMDAGDLNYTLNLGAGIPTGSTAASTADFSDGSDDNIRIPFFGKTFLVQTVDIDSSRIVAEIRLIEDKAKQTFVAGESFTVQGLGIYDGQTLTVTIVSVVATGPAAAAYQAKFNLTDEAGNVIDTQTVSAGNFIDFEDADGDDVVNGDVYVDTAAVNTGTNEGTVDVLVGTSSVRLKDGENYPYNEDADAENVNGPYVVNLNETTDTNKLTSIVVKSRDPTNIGTPDTTAEKLVAGWGKSVWDVDHPLYSKNDALTTTGKAGPYSFEWLNGTGALGEGLFTIQFNGFKTGEEKTYIQIGNNELEFRDSADTLHRIPLWFKAGSETGDGTTGLTSTNNSNGVSFTYDNGSKTLYYDMNKNNQDFNVSNGIFLNGVAVQIITVAGADGNKIQTDFGLRDVNVASSVAQSLTINGVNYNQYAIAFTTTGTVSVPLRADGWARFAKAQINSSTATSDFLNGLGGATNVTGGTPTGMTTAQLANVFFYDDANVSTDGTKGIGYGPLLTLSGDSYSIANALLVNESGSSINSRSGSKGVFLSLLGDISTANTTGNGQAIPTTGGQQNSKQLSFYGTDTGENMGLDANWYIPQRDDYGFDSSSETVNIAWFGVDENNASDFQSRIYIDTRDDEIPNLGGTGNKISSPGSDVNYGRAVAGLNGQTISLSTDTTSSSSLTAAYSDFGTKISIADGETAEFWIPENRTPVEIVVTGASSTSTVSGGEEITVKEGETGTFSAGTAITVKDITYTASVSDGSTVVTNGSAFTYKSPAPLNGKAQVYTDSQSVPGPKIVVGGPLVNSLATAVADQLNSAGDRVSGVYSGNIIVAGYTAEDTGAAAQDLISALDAI